jgi:BirA family transcriptional regulator, biotin operon repressor / biotin---[acetyl-CoA-carboxylase] ligase
VASTLDVVHEYAARGAPGGTTVVAEEQLEGRGTRGRTWHSPPGGLWCSVLYRDAKESGLEFLSLRVGLAVAAAIESVLPGQRLGLKWPNDLMLGERKVGGVLCEARWHGAILGWVAVGVGINVVNPPAAGLEATAASLRAVAPDITVEQLVAPVTSALRDLLLQVDGLSREELAEFQGRDWLQGRALLEPVAGIARGVQPDGSLLVEREGGAIVSLKAGRILLG